MITEDKEMNMYRIIVEDHKFLAQVKVDQEWETLESCLSALTATRVISDYQQWFMVVEG